MLISSATSRMTALRSKRRLRGLGLGNEPPQAADNLRRPVGLLAHLVQRADNSSPGRLPSDYSSRLQAWE